MTTTGNYVNWNGVMQIIPVNGIPETGTYLPINGIYVGDSPKRVYFPCFDENGLPGYFVPIAGTTSAPAPSGIPTQVISASQTLAINTSYVLENSTSITLSLPTGQVTGSTISIFPDLNTAGYTVLATAPEVIVIPNNQPQSSGYTSGFVPANVIAPIVLTYVATTGSWLQSGVGLLIPS